MNKGEITVLNKINNGDQSTDNNRLRELAEKLNEPNAPSDLGEMSFTIVPTTAWTSLLMNL